MCKEKVERDRKDTNVLFSICSYIFQGLSRSSLIKSFKKFKAEVKKKGDKMVKVSFCAQRNAKS